MNAKAFVLCSESQRGSEAIAEVLGPWSTERAAMTAGLASRRKNLMSGNPDKIRDFSIHVLDAERTSQGKLSLGGVIEAKDFLSAEVTEEQAVLLKGIPAQIFLVRTLPAIEERFQAA